MQGEREPVTYMHIYIYVYRERESRCSVQQVKETVFCYNLLSLLSFQIFLSSSFLAMAVHRTLKLNKSQEHQEFGAM